MRGYYLNPSSDGNGCRGGVGSNDSDYELEIGQNKNCSFEMIAHCAMIDEIDEFLRLSNTPLAQMIIAAKKKIISELHNKTYVGENESN